MQRRATRSMLPALVAGLVLGMVPATSSAAPGFLTAEPAYITLTGGGDVLPIITVGETLGGFLFEGIPDGIGLTKGEHRHTVDVYVAHEQSEVPFPPLSGALGPPLTDFQDASVSKLTLDTRTGEVLDADVALPASAGFIRFCSAFMAGRADGFDHPTFFANEESNDQIEVPPGAPYGPDPSIAPLRQAGFAVALDTETGDYRQIRGLGRYNHENTISLRGNRNGKIGLLSTDDTFDGPSAQLYLYLARNDRAVWNDRGHLFAFRVTEKNGGRVKPGDAFNDANDYLDLRPGDDLAGRFIRVPDRVADGTTDLAPQAALEEWSNEHNVFQFIRLEDLTADVHDPRTIYVADTGRDRVIPDPNTGRLIRGPSGTVGQADKGSVFEMVFARRNPRVVKSLTVLAQGDDTSGDAFVPFTSPDNLGSSAKSLMMQEDTSNAKIWRHDLGSGDWNVVATVDDPVGESSGIVDASSWFGQGTWLLTVQAHGTFQESQVVPNPSGSGPDLTIKREDGQLLLMKIPGS
jgi:hypothetical protein